MSNVITLRPHGRRPGAPSPDDEHLEAEILAGWQRSRVACRYRPASIEAALGAVRQLRAFCGQPLMYWDCATMNDFSVALREAEYAHETMRQKQMAIRSLFDYACDPAYPWVAACRARGYELHQICTPENTIAHCYGAPSVDRRALADDERHALFTAVLAKMEHADRRGCKGALPIRRDYALLHAPLAFGIRDHETVMGDLRDLPAAFTPYIMRFSAFEGYQVRFGKACHGGPPQRRFVPAVHLFRNSYAALAWYLRDVRPHLAAPENRALFPSERRERLREDTVSALFAQYRDLAGLDSALTFHCLRHTYASLLAQAGFEVAVISKLLGHAHESTTLLYLHVPDGVVRARLLAHHQRLVGEVRNAR